MLSLRDRRGATQCGSDGVLAPDTHVMRLDLQASDSHLLSFPKYVMFEGVDILEEALV